MRIVKIVETLGVGGLPNYALSVAKALAARGHEIILAHGNKDVPAHLETGGVKLAHLSDWNGVQSLAPDLVHVHLLSDNKGIESLFSLGVPLVRSFHDYTSTCLRRGKRRWPGDRCQRPLDYKCAAFGCLIGRPGPGAKIPFLMNLPAKIAERDAYRRFDAAIVGSRHMAGMLETNGFESGKIFIIPYFSAFADKAEAPIEKPLGIPGYSRPFELLFSGQAVTGKGLEVLIEALAGVPQDWRLTVCSDGPRLAHARQKAGALNIAERISFHTWMPQSALAEMYKKADLFVLPSIWDDPGPLVGIEAMSFAAPVIGFAVGGIPDYLIDGETGFLVEDVSAKGLHEGLCRAMHSTPETLARIGREAQKRVREHHSESVHVGALEKLYLDLAGRARHKKIGSQSA